MGEAIARDEIMIAPKEMMLFILAGVDVLTILKVADDNSEFRICAKGNETTGTGFLDVEECR